MSEESKSSDGIDRQAEVEIIRNSFRVDQAENTQEWRKFHSQQPSTLYHYTTAGGLAGILDSQSIWVSDVRFMNDASELTYAIDFIEKTVQEVLNEATDERLKSALSEVAKFVSVSQFGPQPFCACFCEQGDLLSQWRGYTPGKLGYSMGLDLRNTGTLIPLPPNSVMRKVIYDDGEQRRWVRRITETWLRSVEGTISSRAGEEVSFLFPYPAIWSLQEALIEPQLCFKNPAFSEEKEWRLIKLVAVTDELEAVNDRRMRERYALQGVTIPKFAGPSNAEGVEIKFRQSSLGFIPYITMELSPKAGVFTGRLPLKNVIQGPTTAPGLSLRSLEMYLRSKGYSFPNTNISPSRIPLRS